jgi:hypothetical protein
MSKSKSKYIQVISGPNHEVYIPVRVKQETAEAIGKSARIAAFSRSHPTGMTQNRGTKGTKDGHFHDEAQEYITRKRLKQADENYTQQQMIEIANETLRNAGYFDEANGLEPMEAVDEYPSEVLDYVNEEFEANALLDWLRSGNLSQVLDEDLADEDEGLSAIIGAPIEATQDDRALTIVDEQRLRSRELKRKSVDI